MHTCIVAQLPVTLSWPAGYPLQSIRKSCSPACWSAQCIVLPKNWHIMYHCSIQKKASKKTRTGQHRNKLQANTKYDQITPVICFAIEKNSSSSSTYLEWWRRLFVYKHRFQVLNYQPSVCYKQLKKRIPSLRLESMTKISRILDENHHELLVGSWVEPTHLKNMRKSNWIISPNIRGEFQEYLGCHHLDYHEFLSLFIPSRFFLMNSSLSRPWTLRIQKIQDLPLTVHLENWLQSSLQCWEPWSLKSGNRYRCPTPTPPAK